MAKRKAISAVITCGDWLRFENEVAKIEENDIEYIHVDVMDGTLVPNFMLGPDIVRKRHQRTADPLDIHLMAVEPEEKIGYFELRPEDRLSFHLEGTLHPEACIRAIRRGGGQAGISLSPKIAVEAVVPYWEQLDYVNVMCVQPGFAGQPLWPGARERLTQVCRLAAGMNHHVEIEVDGNVSIQNAAWMSELGAELFVAGSSSIYGPGCFCDNVKRLREAIRHSA